MSRIDKLKEQHPVLGMSIIDLLAKADPTKTNKYLELMHDYSHFDIETHSDYDSISATARIMRDMLRTYLR
jgi:hypothetical protein